MFLLTCSAHVTTMDRPLRPCDPETTTNPFYSYHIHVLFWQTNANSTGAALALRDSFAKEFNVRQDCPIEAKDPAPEQRTICSFGVDMEPAGPFLTAQWSFFIPKGYYRFSETVEFIMQNRGTLDSFIHPNSGCTTKDHSDWSLWGGTKWELDSSIFSS